jgi:hypothetical protein
LPDQLLTFEHALIGTALHLLMKSVEGRMPKIRVVRWQNSIAAGSAHWHTAPVSVAAGEWPLKVAITSTGLWRL